MRPTPTLVPTAACRRPNTYQNDLQTCSPNLPQPWKAAPNDHYKGSRTRFAPPGASRSNRNRQALPGRIARRRRDHPHASRLDLRAGTGSPSQPRTGGSAAPLHRPGRSWPAQALPPGTNAGGRRGRSRPAPLPQCICFHVFPLCEHAERDSFELAG